MQWIETIKKNWKAISIALTILSGGSFVGFTDFGHRIVNKAKFFWAAEEIVSDLQLQMQLVYEDVQRQQDNQEMTFTMFEDMTEDISQDTWEFGMADGTVYLVDIRRVGKVKTKWAFIYDWHSYYPVYDRRNEGNFTILLHDDKQDYTLIKK